MILALLWTLALAPTVAHAPRPPLLPRPFPARFWSMPYRQPVLHPWLLPYREWTSEYRHSFQRHYHDSSVTFRPSMIVMHYTVSDSAEGVRSGFIRGGQMDEGDIGLVFGHPSVQLMVDKDGTVYQLMPLDRRCTGAYGVNHVALSIEMVAKDENDLLSRPRQVFASLCLVRYLMREFSIPLAEVHSHFEVSVGRWLVPEYTDYGDHVWPSGYPPAAFRFDPGFAYMGWLRLYVGRVGAAPAPGRVRS